MKITIELAGELFVAAREAAIERRTTLRELIERGLRHELGRQPVPVKPARIRWVTVEGGLPPGVNVSDREQIRKWIG